MSQPQTACLPDTAGQANELDVSSFGGLTGFAVLDQNGCLVSANARLLELLDDRVRGSGKLDPFSLELHSHSAKELADALTGTDNANLQLDFSNGVRRYLQLGQLRASRRLLLISATHFEESSQADPELDALTGLGNRHRLQQTLSRLESDRTRLSAPHGSTLSNDAPAILLVDIDRFKQINDTLGYRIGDSLLKLVCSRLRRLTTESDPLLRIGGDEFLLVLHASDDAHNAIDLAERIVDLMSRPFLVEAQQLDIGVSIGIAFFDEQTPDSATLLQHADLALQQAKTRGRRQACIFQPSMAVDAQRRRALEIDMRRALALQQFRLVYQPQVDLRSGRLVGFEALLRWEHPVRGMVSPAEFIPIAEDTGEIRRIGAWVILQACLQASLWPDGLKVAVNVSPLQFDDGNLPEHIDTALQQSNLPPEQLEVEVTEGLLFQNPDAALAQLSRIRQMNVDIAMDDFGTGYASLSHLSRFPFTKVKIDQSFVRGAVDDRTQALVSCIISLGSSLGMRTLAEGVETSEQYRRLQESGCDAVQGYLISRPLEAGSVGNFVERCTRQIQGGDVAA